MKQPKVKTEIPSRYVLAIMSLLCLMLIFMGYISNAENTVLVTVSNYMFVPMQKGIAAVGSTIASAGADSREKAQLIEEIEQCHAKIDQLQNDLNTALIYKSKIEEYEKLLNLTEMYSNYQTMGARIIAASTTNWFDTFTIDKGSEDGIELNMNVMADQGLVGIVSEVGSHFAVVRTIIDDSSNVSAMISTTGDNCIVSGSLSQVIKNNLLPYTNLYDSTDMVSVGDYVVTSNISDKYLPGLLIGYVSSIQSDSNDLTKSGNITPVVDFKHLSTVLVITTTKETYANGNKSSN